MFGHSFHGIFNNDPFFRHHQQQMRQMNAMMGPTSLFPDPFMPEPAVLPAAITDGQQPGRYPVSRDAGALQPAFVDPFQNMFGQMNRTMASMHSMMGNVHQMMEQQRSDPNTQGHFYSQSTVMSYDGSRGGQPQVYQATSSSVQGPGGVRETRKAVRDTARGEQKMSVGRHIHDRGHVVERSLNVNTRDVEENQEYVNLDEGEVESFHREFRERMGPVAGGRGQRRALHGHRYSPTGGPRQPRAAITYNEQR